MDSYFNPRNCWRVSKATPTFSMHDLCNPITCNVGLQTGASMDAGAHTDAHKRGCGRTRVRIRTRMRTDARARTDADACTDAEQDLISAYTTEL